MKKISEIIRQEQPRSNMILSLEPELTNEIKISFQVVYRMVCPNVTITEEMKPVLRNLCTYFMGIEGVYSLNKGIYLYGEYGVGKTTLMLTFRKWLADYFPFSGNGFSITSIEEIIDIYKTSGNLDKFVNNKEEYGYPNPRHLLINEFGKEVKDKIYGTEAQQIINSFMMRRYEVFQSYGKVTHVTSNFLPKSNDPALNDRYVEMFNLIELKGESFRK